MPLQQLVVVVVVVVGQASALHSCQVLDAGMSGSAPQVPNHPRASRPSGLAYTVRTSWWSNALPGQSSKRSPLRAQGWERALGYSVLPAVPCLDDYSPISLPRNLAGPRLGQKLSKLQIKLIVTGNISTCLDPPPHADQSDHLQSICKLRSCTCPYIRFDIVIKRLLISLAPRSMFLTYRSHTQAARESKQA